MRPLPFLLCLAACAEAPQPATPQVDRQRVEQEVRSMFRDYADACERDGLLGEFAFLDSSAAFFWVPPGFGGPIGLDSVHAVLRKNAPSIRAMDTQWKQLRVDVLGDSLASYTGLMHATTVTVQNDTQHVDLLETGLVVKRGTGWKLLSGQTSVAPK